MDIFLVKKPHVTEKSSDLKEIGKYVFIVKSSAAKSEIKKAVKEIYKVDAIKINTVNLPGKTKMFRGVNKGKSAGVKKAVVTLKPGQKMEV